MAPPLPAQPCLQVAASSQARVRAVQRRSLPGRELEQMGPLAQAPEVAAQRKGPPAVEQAQRKEPPAVEPAQRKGPPAVEPGRVARPAELAVAAEFRERAVFS